MRIALLAGLVSVLVACSPSTPTQTPSATSVWSDTVKEPVDWTSGGVSYTPSSTAPVAPAHKRYLEDVFRFTPFENSLTETETAVIGSRVARFYPVSVEPLLRKAATVKLDSGDVPTKNGRPDESWTMQGLEKLPPGKPIPFGTILPLLKGEATSSDDGTAYPGVISGPIYRYFAFQGNYNQFYRTRFEGVEGYVFGADLFGLYQTPLENQIASDLYLTAGRPAAFRAVTGSQALDAAVEQRLTEARLAFQATQYQRDYYLGFTEPDDLIANYTRLVPSQGQNYQTVFLTTDLAAHAQHLVFDRILQYEEEAYFSPRLKILIGSLQAAVDRWKDANPQADPWPSTLATRYLQMADTLLKLAPEVVVEKDQYNRSESKYVDVNRDSVLRGLPAEVLNDLNLMDKAEGFAPSAILTKDARSKYMEDFSQYKPRGHYTKNGILKAYFRAMMWFGRINFLIARSGEQPFAMEDDTSGSSEALTMSMEPTALLFTDLISRNPDLYKAWADLFDPITALIGLSDDLSFQEVMPLWKEQNVSDVAAWTSKKENLLAFMEKAHQKLRPPAISGNSVLWGPSEGPNRAPPMGWRLFGQRFTWDSYVHQQVSPPRLMSRDMVRGLDIMKAFGSKTADSLLAASDYPEMAGLEAELNETSKIFADWKTEEWNKTFYNQTLFTIRSQALFEPGVGFYFTESPAWGLKAMISSHGTWAELRHDTLLYVKQVYGERAGDGDFDATFRTEPIPRPVHYIEPNLPFWQGLTTAVQGLGTVLGRYDLLDEEGRTALRGLEALYVRAASIVEKEVADQPVERSDLDWIPGFARELVPLVMVYNRTGDVADEELLKMALIADVYTNVERRQVLEVGVGVPLRLYVPLNDAQGGKRIAVGFTFSYYEFAHPMGERLTDEAWKAMAYPSGEGVLSKLPFWARGLTLPPRTN